MRHCKNIEISIDITTRSNFTTLFNFKVGGPLQKHLPLGRLTSGKSSLFHWQLHSNKMTETIQITRFNPVNCK